MGTGLCRYVSGLSLLMSMATPGNAALPDGDLIFGDSPRASDAELDGMRGGFEVNAGNTQLKISFGIERAVFINGDLVTQTKLTIPDLSASIQSQVADAAQVTAPAAPAAPQIATPTAPVAPQVTPPPLPAPVQVSAPTAPPPPAAPAVAATPDSQTGSSGPVAATAQPALPPANPSAQPTVVTGGSVGAAQPAAPQASPSPQQPVLAFSGNPGVSAAPQRAATVSSVQPQPTAASNGPLSLVVQNGTGNAVAVALPSASSLQGLPPAVVTLIQNSLDNQVIRTVNTLNIRLNSLDLARALSLSTLTRDMLVRSVR
jgi:hypothetical protein